MKLLNIEDAGLMALVAAVGLCGVIIIESDIFRGISALGFCIGTFAAVGNLQVLISKKSQAGERGTSVGVKKPDDIDEAQIDINGRKLNSAQSAVILIAVESFDKELETDGLGEDANGIALCSSYRARISEIRSALYK